MITNKTETVLRRPDKLERLADLLMRLERNIAIVHDDLREAKSIYRSLSSESLDIANDVGLF